MFQRVSELIKEDCPKAPKHKCKMFMQNSVDNIRKSNQYLFIEKKLNELGFTIEIKSMI